MKKRISSLLLGALLVAAGFVLGRMGRGTPDTAQAARHNAPTVAARNANAAVRRTEPVDAPRPNRVAAAVRAAHSAPDAASRLYRFSLRLHDLDPAEYPALLAALRAARTPESPEILAMLCSEWARHDGPAAFAAARALAGNDGEYRAWHSAIAAWAQREPAAAQAALRAIGATDLASDEMSALVRGWAAADPAAAEAFLMAPGGPPADTEGLPAAVLRGFEAIACARIDADPAGAMAWYGALPEGMQERLRQAIVAKLAAVDAPRATEWLARDPSAQLGASDVQSVLRGMQLENFEQQFAWANMLANPVTRESALAAVVRERSADDIVSLGEWLAVRCDDAKLAPAFSVFAAQVVKKSPAAAVTWAMSLDDPTLRQRTLETVVLEWNGVDPRAARQWAAQTGLVDWNTIAR